MAHRSQVSQGNNSGAVFKEALSCDNLRLQPLLDLSPVAIALTRLADDKIIDVNPVWEQLTGYSKQEVLLKSPLKLNLWCHPDQRQRFLELLVKQGIVKDFEFLFRNKSGGFLYLLICARRIEQNNKSYILSMAQDITELKRLAKALQEREQRYAIAERMAHVGHYERDFIADTSHWSPEVYRIFGLNPNFPGPTFAQFMALIHPDDRRNVISQVHLARVTSRPTEFEYRIVRPDGKIRSIRSLISSIYQIDGQSSKILGTLVDITDQKKMQKRLDAIAQSERQAIYRDLHDSVCQNLSGMTFLLDSICNEAKFIDHSNSKDHLRKIMKLALETIEMARNIANGLLPLSNAPDALICELEKLVAYIRQVYRILCKINCTGQISIPSSNTSTQLFLIAREAVINAVKHSEAGRIDLSLNQHKSMFFLQVKDNGNGMLSTAGNRGHGLQLMRDRAVIIGAELKITSCKGVGTVVECRLSI